MSIADLPLLGPNGIGLAAHVHRDFHPFVGGSLKLMILQSLLPGDSVLLGLPSVDKTASKRERKGGC
jgi:hypothetical protein